MTNVQQQIEIRRTAVGMSLKTLSKKTGINIRILEDIQQGKSPLTIHLLDISEALDCSITDFVDYGSDVVVDRVRFLEAGRKCTDDAKQRAELLMQIIEYTNDRVALEYTQEEEAVKQQTAIDAAEAECIAALKTLNADGLLEARRQIGLLLQIPKFKKKEM